jgi:hypothetical protein
MPPFFHSLSASHTVRRTAFRVSISVGQVYGQRERERESAHTMNGVKYAKLLILRALRGITEIFPYYDFDFTRKRAREREGERNQNLNFV